MIAGAIICYGAAIGMVLFLPALHAAGGAPESMLQLVGSGQAGEIWIGVVLIILGVAGIVLTAMKKKATLNMSAFAGFAGFALGIVSFATSAVKASTLGGYIVPLIMPLLFIWAAMIDRIYLYIIKNKAKQENGE